MTLFKNDSNYQDPFAGIDSLLEQFGRGFRKTLSETVTARQIPVNLYETDGAYEIRAELPGVKKADVSVELDNAVLEIKATRKQPGKDATSETSMVRRITVGDDVESGNVKARLEDGILAIHLPKREAHKPKSINVA